MHLFIIDKHHTILIFTHLIAAVNQTNIMNESTFIVSNITWEYFTSSEHSLKIVPDIKNAPLTVTIPCDELDVHELPEVEACSYEAERDWMIQGYLLDSYKMLAESFDVQLV